MRSHRLFVLILAIMMTPTLSFAIPYSSQIGVDPSSTAVGGGLDINYVLNEPADSVTIEILDAGSLAVAATFAGTAATGENSVSWNGTADNAGGADIGVGDYRVRITADKNVAGASWYVMASNRSTGAYDPPAELETLFLGFSGMDILIQNEQDSDLFGLLFVSSSVSYDHAAAIVLKADTSIYNGTDGYETRVMKTPEDASPEADAFYTDFWGTDWDTDNMDSVWIAGQGLSEIMFATNALDPVASNVGGADFDPIWPRSMAVTDAGGTKLAFICSSPYTSSMLRAEIGANNKIVQGTLIDILGLATAGRYTKDVETDDNGNVYWFSRYSTSPNGAALYRWDAAMVQAATAGELTEASAAWDIQFPAADTQGKGVTIDPSGDVFVASTEGIYYVGNTSTATLTKTLGDADKIVDVSGFGASTYGANICADSVGNVYWTNRSREHVFGWGPPGNHSTAVTGPLSQTFSIVTITGLDTWSDYR